MICTGRKTNRMKNIMKALAAFQDEVPVIHQETEGYNYTYANLNTIFEIIKPLLKTHGLTFVQSLDGKNLKTVLFHLESGELIEGSVEIDTNVSLSSMNKYQVFGSAITYFRRYSLSCMLGLITDKDIDAKGKEEKPTPPPKPATVLSDGKINKIIEEGNQKAALESIDSGDCTVTNEQLIKLNA